MFSGTPFSPPPPHRPNPPFTPPPPPLPISREAMKELQQFVVLMLLNEKEDGLTGYELEKKHNLPRITVVRILETLVAEGYVSTKEEIVSGRAHKYYKLTEKGKEYYNVLKEKWAFNFAIMAEQVPPKPFVHPMFNRLMKAEPDSLLLEFSTKEDILDYLHSLRFETKKQEERLQRRLKHITFLKGQLSELIQKINKLESYDIDTVKRLLAEFRDAIIRHGEHNGSKKVERI